MHPCCQNVSESEWSGTHPHRQVWYHARIAILPEAGSVSRLDRMHIPLPDQSCCETPWQKRVKIGIPHGTERRSGRGSGHAADLACRGVGFADRGAVDAVSRRCNVAVIVDERDPTAVRMQDVGGIRREVRRAVAWRIKWLSQRRGSLVGPLPWSGLCREWQKTVGLALPPD